MNDGIDPQDFSLLYIKVDQVIRMVSGYGPGALMAKFDVECAYRNIPVHPDDRFLLGMMWRGLCRHQRPSSSISDAFKEGFLWSHRSITVLEPTGSFLAREHTGISSWSFWIRQLIPLFYKFEFFVTSPLYSCNLQLIFINKK